MSRVPGISCTISGSAEEKGNDVDGDAVGLEGRAITDSIGKAKPGERRYFRVDVRYLARSIRRRGDEPQST